MRLCVPVATGNTWRNVKFEPLNWLAAMFGQSSSVFEIVLQR